MPNETSELFALAAQYFLKEYKEKGGSQNGLAKELGVTNAYISSVVNGSRSASFDLYTQIAKRLYGPLDKFLIVGRRLKDGLPPQPDEQSGQEDEAEHLITRLAYYILDHRRIAKEIQELKQFYESIVENLQSAVMVMDSNNEVTFANKQMENICGILPDEVIGKSPLLFEKTTPGLKIYPFVQKYQTAFEQLKPLYYENILFNTSRGPSRYISGWLIPLLDEKNKYQGMICTLRDTSDSYATFSLLIETVEHIQDAVVILQQTAPKEIPTAFFANKKFRKIFNFADIDPFSLPFEKLVEIIKENIVNKEEWEQFIQTVIEENSPTTKFVFELKSGKKYFATGNPIHNKQGSQIGRMATLKESE
jgi:PAS domain S-box-containing protein